MEAMGLVASSALVASKARVEAAVLEKEEEEVMLKAAAAAEVMAVVATPDPAVGMERATEAGTEMPTVEG